MRKVGVIVFLLALFSFIKAATLDPVTIEVNIYENPETHSKTAIVKATVKVNFDSTAETVLNVGGKISISGPANLEQVAGVMSGTNVGEYEMLAVFSDIPSGNYTATLSSAVAEMASGEVTDTFEVNLSSTINTNFSVSAYTPPSHAPDASAAYVELADGATYANKPQIKVAFWGFTDPDGDIDSYQVSFDPAFSSYASTESSPQYLASGDLGSLVPSPGSVTVYVRAHDASGNVSLAKSDNIIYDPFAPKFISFDPTSTNETQPLITIHVKDDRITIPASYSDAFSDIDFQSTEITIDGVKYVPNGAAVAGAVETDAISYEKAAGDERIIKFDLEKLGLTLSQSSHNVVVKIADKAGNSTTNNYSITVGSGSTTGGKVIQPLANTYISNSKPVIKGQIADPDLVDVSTIVMYVNGIKFAYGNTFLTTNPTDGYAESVEVTLNTPLDLADGTVEVRIEAKDKYGNDCLPLTWQFNVDTIAPQVVGANPSNNSSVAVASFTYASFEIKENGAGVGKIQITVTNNTTTDTKTLDIEGGSLAVPTSLGTFTYNATAKELAYSPSGLNPGSLEIKLTLSDMAKTETGADAPNTGEEYTWSIKLVSGDGPILSFTQPEKNMVISVKRPVIKIKLHDENGVASDSVILRVNGMPFDALSGYLSFADETDQTLEVTLNDLPIDLIEGENKISVQAKDKLGTDIQPNPTIFSFYLDTKGPEFSDVVPATDEVIGSLSPVINVDITDSPAGVSPNSIEVKIKNNENESASIEANTSDAVSYNPLTNKLTINVDKFGLAIQPGTLEVYIFACDKASDEVGNAKGNCSTLNLTYKISDGNAPKVFDTVPAAGSATNELQSLSIKISGATIEMDTFALDINGYVLNGASPRFEQKTLADGSHEIVLKDIPDFLRQEGTISVIVTDGKDIFGNEISNLDYEFEFAYDLTGPVVEEANPSDVVVFSTKPKITVKLKDNLSGVSQETLVLNVNGQNIGIASTELTFDPASGLLTFIPSDELTTAQSADITVTVPDTIQDIAGNGLNKTKTEAEKDFEFTFKILNPNSVNINLVYPAENAYVNPRNDDFKFKWEPLLDDEDIKPDHWQLKVYSDLSLTNTLIDETVDGATTEYVPSAADIANIIASGECYWRVEAVDKLGNVIRSVIRKFTVDSVKPSKPTITKVEDYLNGNPYQDTNIADGVYVSASTFKIYVTIPNTTENIKFKVYRVVGDLDTTTSDSDDVLIGEANYSPFSQDTPITVRLPNIEGKYMIYVKSVDLAGNESDPSDIMYLYLDTTAPTVENVVITNSNPVGNGPITSGKVLLSINFDDNTGLMDLADYAMYNLPTPEIYIDPAGTGAVKLENVNIKNNTITGEFWIPFGHSSEWDGMASIVIKGVLDKARNGLPLNSLTLSNYFEINTAPSFNVRVVPNPVDPRYMLIHVESSEKLNALPVVWASTANGDITIPMKQVRENVFLGSFKGEIGETSIKVSGTDMYGNTGFWPEPDRDSETRAIVYIFDSRGIEKEGVKIVSKTKVAALLEETRKVKLDGLKVESGIINIEVPQNLKFDFKEKYGLYDLDNKKWTRSVENAGNYVIVKDDIAPTVISLVGRATNKTFMPRFEFIVQDTGSGVDLSTIDATIGGKEMKKQLIGNKLILTAPYIMKPGNYDVSIKISDRADNVGFVQITKAVISPISLRVLPAPNPVMSDTANILITANGVISASDIDRVEMKIYTTSGRLVRILDFTNITNDVTTDFNNTLKLTWDLTNYKNRKVRRGVYFVKVKLRAGEQVATAFTKLVVLR